MAKYFRLSNATFADDFKKALEAYYGDGVTVTSASNKTIIFTCLAVCDKELKFEATNAGFNPFIGTVHFSRSNGGTADGYNLILSDSFLLLDTVSSNSAYRNSALAAKLTNGRYMVAGGQGTDEYDGYRENNKCLFTDTMVIRPIRMVAPVTSGFKSNGKLCLLPSFVADDLEMELNDDGTFASIPGLYLAATSGAGIVGSNYYLSNAPLKGLSTEGIYCLSQKYVELEME